MTGAGWLVVADVAAKSLEFRVAAVYAPNIAVERVSFCRRLAPFFDNPKWISLVGDLNMILDPKIDRVRRGARGLGRYESNLIDLPSLGRQVSSGSPREGDVDMTT